MRRALALSILLAAASAPAWAQWSIDGKVERFRWEEKTQPRVTETGPRFGLGLGYTQNKTAGWMFAYKGEFYGGDVKYRGATLLTGEPVESTTSYTGLLNELQAIYRSSGGGAQIVTGLGLDYWNRQLTPDQHEEWYVYYVRAGAEFGGRLTHGLFAGAGIKYPVYIYEDAHLGEIGFDSNPKLHPGRAPSFYADLGYRLGRRWTVLAYYDAYRFKESPQVRTSSGGQNFIVFQPESTVDTFGLRVRYHF